MPTVSVRFEDEFFADMSRAMKGNRYTTKAEFIREAVREKLRDLEKEEALFRIESIFGASKRKTTEAALLKAKDKAFDVVRKRAR